MAVDPQELSNLCHAPSPALLAVVVPSIARMSPALLRTRLLTDVSLPAYGVPDKFVVVDELPVNAHGESLMYVCSYHAKAGSQEMFPCFCYSMHNVFCLLYFMGSSTHSNLLPENKFQIIVHE